MKKLKRHYTTIESGFDLRIHANNNDGKFHFDCQNHDLVVFLYYIVDFIVYIVDFIVVFLVLIQSVFVSTITLKQILLVTKESNPTPSMPLALAPRIR